ncbi:MAG: N-acetyltransferase [Fibrobacteria bacterium]|nr:N-acetyltransferase [Fibrobacteria bacterium]
MSQNNVFIAPGALVESDEIGEGTRIWRHAHIMPGALIGTDCNIGEGCYVEGHVHIGNGVTIKNGICIWENITLEDDVFVGPAAVFTNDYRPRAFKKMTTDDLLPTVVKRGATIGANSTIVCGITIGEYAFVGAGSVVTKEVLPFHIVFGNPAVSHGLVCKCAERIPGGITTHTCSCGLSYHIDGEVIREA